MPGAALVGLALLAAQYMPHESDTPTAEGLRMAIIRGDALHQSATTDGKHLYRWHDHYVVCEVDADEQPSICRRF